jgi:hypothetical protein
MSNRKKPNKPRRQHPSAHLDGLQISGSCCRTVFSTSGNQDGPTIWLKHEPSCTDWQGPAKQMLSAYAAVEELRRHGETAVAVIGEDGRLAGMFILDKGSR